MTSLVVTESVFVDAPPAVVYEAVSAIKPLSRWSPEFIGAWVRRPVRVGTHFTGFNRRRYWLWFTNSVVTRADTDREFAFSVSTFRMPVAEWGFTFEPDGGGTLVTEIWRDLRLGRSAPVAKLLGLLFTGVRASDRGVVNAAGMRSTLAAMSASFGAHPK